MGKKQARFGKSLRRVLYLHELPGHLDDNAEWRIWAGKVVRRWGPMFEHPWILLAIASVLGLGMLLAVRIATWTGTMDLLVGKTATRPQPQARKRTVTVHRGDWIDVFEQTGLIRMAYQRLYPQASVVDMYMDQRRIVLENKLFEDFKADHADTAFADDTELLAALTAWARKRAYAEMTSTQGTS